MCVDSKMQKVTVNSDLSEIIPLLARKIDELKQHIHTIKEQQTAYNKIKENLSGNEVMVHVHYAESYENKSKMKCKVLILDIPILVCLRHAVMTKKVKMVSY